MIKIKTSCGQRFTSNKDNVIRALDEAKQDYINFYAERKVVPSKIVSVTGGDDYSKAELNELYNELVEEIQSKQDDFINDDQEDVVEGFKLSSEEAWNMMGGGR